MEKRPATLPRVYEKSNNTVLEVVPPSSHSISLRVGEKPNRDKRVLRKSRPAFSPSDRERQMKKVFFCAKMERESPTAHPSPCLYRVPAREMNADGFQGLRRRHWRKNFPIKAPSPPILLSSLPLALSSRSAESLPAVIKTPGPATPPPPPRQPLSIFEGGPHSFASPLCSDRRELHPFSESKQGALLTGEEERFDATDQRSR